MCIIYFNITAGVTIVSKPVGTLNDDDDGQPKMFHFPILGSVTLMCMVTLANGDLPSGIATYKWDTTGCYTNTAYNGGNPNCFPNGQMTRTVTGKNLLAEDAGTISCTATINEMEYKSHPATIHISGESLMLAVAIT